jgi:RHS repeat-associated protein
MPRRFPGIASTFYYLCIVGLLIFSQVSISFATSCDPQGGVDLIGEELIAAACISDGMNDGTAILFKRASLICSNGTVTIDPDGYSYYYSVEPATVIGEFRYYNFRIFRNTEGTHLLGLHRYYTGLIDGKSMSSYPAGQVQTDVFSTGIYTLPPTPNCQGGDFNPPSNEICSGSTVNLGTGRLSHSQDLFSTKSSQPLALNISLNYRSKQFAPSAIGTGWSHSYEMTLASGAGNSKVFWNNGARRIYNNYNGTFVSPKADFSTLVKNADNTFTITEKDGLTRNFDTNGLATSIVDRNGNSLIFNYTNGKLLTVNDPNGRTVSFAYDGNDKLSTITDPGSNVYTFTYNSGNLTGVNNANTGGWAYSYGSNGLLATKTDPESNIVTYDNYDSNNRLTSTTDPTGKIRGYVFQAVSSPGKVPDPYPPIVLISIPFVFTEKDGNTWSYTYDTLTENILTKTDPLGNITSYTYDSKGDMLTKTEPGIGTTTYTYDNKGNALTVKDPLNQITTYTYNNFGQILTITGAPGNTTNTYDTKGNLLTTTDPSTALTQYGYDSKGNLTTITDARNKVTTLAYDAATNNLASITLPSTGATQFTYDGNGNLLTIIDARNKTTVNTYDSRNRLLTSTDPLGNVTTYTYDKSGNPATLKDGNNKVTIFSYNFQGQLTSVKDALNNITGYNYGLAGCPSCTGVDQLVAITDPKSNNISWTYDTVGRLITEKDALNKTTTFTYEATNTPASKIDANNVKTLYTYDNLQRLTTKTYPDTTTENYTYDSRNNILTASNPNISYTFTYDGSNRILSATDNRGYAIAYEYDGNGNRTKMTLQPGSANQRIIIYTYDDTSRLATMVTPTGTFTYGYDLNNRRTSLLYPNTVTATYGYDDSSRLTSLSHSGITSASYTYDNVGNRKTKTGATNESYTYDDTYRLTQAVTPRGSENFTYDPAGNRTTGPGPHDTAFQHDAANRMTTGKQYTYTYDNNGNQATRTLSNSPGKGWTLTWDFENRLNKMERTKGAERRTVNFKYDPFGRRIWKQLITTLDGTPQTTKTTTWTYIYDNDDIAVELYDDGSAVTATRYIHGPDTDEHLAMERNSGSFYFYHADGLGSITAITDASNTPQVVQSYTYSAYGVPTASNSTFRNSYAHAGREWEPETALYYHWLRYRDTLDGNFISKDPVSIFGGLNVYSFVKNNPINLVDNDGLDPSVPGQDLSQPNPVTRCHVNPHNDRCENFIGGVIIGTALVCISAPPILSDIIVKDPPHKGLGPHLHYGPKYPGSAHPKFHFGPKNPNFGSKPFDWLDWLKNGLPWRWK